MSEYNSDKEAAFRLPQERAAYVPPGKRKGYNPDGSADSRCPTCGGLRYEKFMPGRAYNFARNPLTGTNRYYDCWVAAESGYFTPQMLREKYPDVNTPHRSFVAWRSYRRAHPWVCDRCETAQIRLEGRSNAPVMGILRIPTSAPRAPVEETEASPGSWDPPW